MLRTIIEINRIADINISTAMEDRIAKVNSNRNLTIQMIILVIKITIADMINTIVKRIVAIFSNINLTMQFVVLLLSILSTVK